MNVYLMFKDKDFNFEKNLPLQSEEVAKDLGVDILLNYMSNGDEFVYNVSKKSLLSPLEDIDTILYRQNILKDCIKNPDIINAIYNITLKSINAKNKAYFGFFNKYPSGILYSSVKLMELFLDLLKELSNIAANNHQKFYSAGLKRFFDMIIKEIDDEYLSIIKTHLKTLEFKDGILMSAKLDKNSKGTDYTIRTPHTDNKGWIAKLVHTRKKDSYSFSIDERDEAGTRALSQLKDMGINSAAKALFVSANHILKFFSILRAELAFYIGALNLSKALENIGAPVCFPKPNSLTSHKKSFKNLYDICLSLSLNKTIVGNDFYSKDRNPKLFIITGANQGGKSTFLRSIGLSQLMMQCGIFVPAKSYESNISRGVFTHFKKEEDKEMKKGKLEEELARMDKIIDNIKSGSLVLFNESFASTNEIEGSKIAKQIVKALIDNDIEVYFVTHMYKFASEFYNTNKQNIIFLRAQRKKDGTRTFKIEENFPLQTSYGLDLYNKIFK